MEGQRVERVETVVYLKAVVVEAIEA